MKYFKLLVLFLFSFAYSKTTDSTDTNAGIVYGGNHAFIVQAPAGWVLDNSSGINQGLHAVFYPKGGSWERSPVVMYANGIDIDSSETLDSFIDGDIMKFKNDHSGIKIEEIESIIIGEGARTAKAFKFNGGAYPSFEAVAYIKESKNISIFVISSRNKDGLKINYPKFVELVKNYKYIGDQVIINDQALLLTNKVRL